jgi:hypothetical protein
MRPPQSLSTEKAKRTPGVTPRAFEGIDRRNFTDISSFTNSENIRGSTPLVESVFLGNVDGVNFLIEHGADVNKKNSDGTSPLMAALMRGNVVMVQTLLGKPGIIVTKNDEENINQLIEASGKGGKKRKTIRKRRMTKRRKTIRRRRIK